MTAPSPATIAAHQAAIATLTAAITTDQLAATLTAWQQLDRPGFPDDLGDGHYFDGTFLATKRGAELAVTQIHQLPTATMDLWQRLDIEQRNTRERDQLLADLDAEQTGPGRPAIGKPFPVRLPDWRRRIITADAAAAGVKDAELVRWLIGQAYAQLDHDARQAGVERIDLIRTRIQAT